MYTACSSNGPWSVLILSFGGGWKTHQKCFYSRCDIIRFLKHLRAQSSCPRTSVGKLIPLCGLSAITYLIPGLTVDLPVHCEIINCLSGVALCWYQAEQPGERCHAASVTACFLNFKQKANKKTFSNS